MNKQNIFDGLLAAFIVALLFAYFDQKAEIFRLKDQFASLKEDVYEKMIIAKGLQGDPGPKGEKGDRGPQGPKGEPGTPGKTEISYVSKREVRDESILFPAESRIDANVNVMDIDWKDGARDYDGRFEQDFSFRCPPGGRVETVWGTDFYSRDSSICTAAAHAGKITVKDGGIVTIRIKSGARKHRSSLRNGIKSNSYGEISSSYIFL